MSRLTIRLKALRLSRTKSSGILAALVTGLGIVSGDALSTNRLRDFVDVACSRSDCLEAFGQADAHHYLAMGLAIRDGTIGDHQLDWAMAMWSVGMGLAYAAALAVEPIVPVIVGVAALSFITWGCAWWSVLSSFPRSRQRVVCAVGLIVLTMLPQFRDGLFSWLLVFADSLALGFSVLAASVFVEANVQLRAFGRRFQRTSEEIVWRYCVPGGLVASAIYVRPIAEVPFLLVGALAGLVSAVNIAKYLRGKNPRKVYWSAGSRRLWVSLAVATTIAIVFTVPWRLYAHERINGGWSMRASSDAIWTNAWVTSEFLGPEGSWAWDAGYGGWCRSYPTKCEVFSSRESSVPRELRYTGFGAVSIVEYRDAAIETARDDPMPIVVDRIAHWWSAWTQPSIEAAEPWLGLPLAIALLALCVLNILIIAIGVARNRLFFLSAYLALLVGAQVPLLVSHVEERYLYTACVTIALTTVVLVSAGAFAEAIRHIRHFVPSSRVQ